MDNRISIIQLSWWLKIFVANIFCVKIAEPRIAGPQYIKVFTNENFITFDVQKELSAPAKVFKDEHFFKKFIEEQIPPIYKSIDIFENKDNYSIILYFNNDTLKNAKYYFNILGLCNALEKYISSVFQYKVYRLHMDNLDWKDIPDNLYGVRFPPQSFTPCILNRNRLHLFLKKGEQENKPLRDNEANSITQARENDNIYHLKEVLFNALPKVYSTFKIIPFKTHYEIIITLLKL